MCRRRRGLGRGGRTGGCSKSEWRPESLHIAREIAEHARAKGVSPGQFAMAWVLNNRFITAAIGGPRTEEQWEDYVGRAGVPAGRGG